MQIAGVSAEALTGVSAEAQKLHLASETVDLHLDGFIWHRILGYDLHKLHRGGPLGGHFGGHLDFPRCDLYGLNVGGWSITTNPFRTAEGRWRTFQANLEQFMAHLPGGDSDHPVVIARDYGELRAALRSESKPGVHIVLPAIQGGNALEAAPDGPASIKDGCITRITLVHLTNSCYGVTSAPFAGTRRGEGLTAKGKLLVEQLNAERIFVDLAHINEQGFWDAVAVHDKSQPLIVTHTGVDGVRKHWRNIDDAQCKAIADSGGVIGIIFEPKFIGTRKGPRDGRMVVDHLQHIVELVGEDFAALGSDYDGMISPPKGLRHEPAYARLVQWMLDRNWSDTRIKKILGGNFMRAFEALRPGDPAKMNSGDSQAAI